MHRDRKIIRYVVEFCGIFILIFISIFFISNFQTVYNLVYYQFARSVPQNQNGAFFDSEKQYENQIVIPKINVSAPIILAKNRAEILDDLKRGVVFLPPNSNSEEGSGIILGHSSRLLLDPGKYDIVFLFLSKLEKNDDIFIYLANKKSAYKVTDKKIIEVEDLSNLNFQNKKPAIYLITCWPPGTNLKRLAVKIEKNDAN